MADRRERERLKIDLPAPSDYPLVDNNTLLQYQPGRDHLVADPAEIAKSHNYHLAYFGRQHVCEDWEQQLTVLPFAQLRLALYPPTIDEAMTTNTRVLHYDIAPRAHHLVLRIVAEFYFGPNAQHGIQKGTLTVKDTTDGLVYPFGDMTRQEVLSPLGSKYAFVDFRHSMTSSALMEPPIEEIENLQLGIDVGNVVVGLDLYLEGDIGNQALVRFGGPDVSNQMTMNRLSILDDDIRKASNLP